MKPFVFTGRHRFRALGTVVLAAQLAACGGDDGGSKTPSGSDNPPPQVSTKHKLTLQGTVTDEPIANANVTATVGSQSFSATADAAGNYSVNLEVDDAGLTQLIQLAAKGVGDQSHVEFVSLAGSVQALTQAAGADGILSSAENFATQITNVSTAQAALIAAANGGEMPTSAAALQTLAAGINAQDVLDLAAAIKLAVDDAANYPLPSGYTSILALVSDTTARQQFLNDAYEKDPAAFAAVQAAIVQDAGLTKPISIDEDRSITTALLSSEADFSFNYTGRVMHFDFNKDGTGWAISETFDQAMTWVIEGSTVRVTYTSPVTTESFDTENCVDDGGVRQVRARYVSNGATVAFLNEQTVAITTKSNVSYLDCASLAPREDISTVARTVLSMDHFETIDAEELSGATQTIYAYDSAQQRVVADIADLGTDGTGTTRLTNLSFTWELDETGKIVQAQFNDGTTAEYLSFGPIGGSDPVASDLFWEIRTPGDGPVYMGAGASVFADPEYAVDLAVEDVPGRFYQFGIGNEAGGDARLKGFRLRFDANFLGAQEDDYIDELGNLVTVDETVRPSDAFRWTLDGSHVVVRRTWDTVLESDNCLFGSNANCELYDERRIIPIAVNGSRIYWLEQRRFNFDGVTASTPATHLVRFYDYEPLSGAAVSGSAKPRLTTQTSKARALLRGAQLR